MKKKHKVLSPFKTSIYCTGRRFGSQHPHSSYYTSVIAVKVQDALSWHAQGLHTRRAGTCRHSTCTCKVKIKLFLTVEIEIEKFAWEQFKEILKNWNATDKMLNTKTVGTLTDLMKHLVFGQDMQRRQTCSHGRKQGATRNTAFRGPSYACHLTDKDEQF